MAFLPNLDLLSVGIVVAATCVLGFSVYFHDRKSVTNQTFLFFSIVTAFWGVFTYLEYHVSADIGIWFLRLSLFFAVWQAYSLFLFFSVFPYRERIFRPAHRYILMPIVVVTSLLTGTPFVLDKVTEVAQDGKIVTIANGYAIGFFGVVTVALVVSGLWIFLRKLLVAEKGNRRPYIEIQIGMTITFICIIAFNFILPAFFSNARFITFGSVFVFPFVIFTSYAILQEHLFNIKVIATASLVFLLAVASIGEILFADSLGLLIFRTSIFILVLVFGISLVRGVLREVEQREKIQKLAQELEKSNEQLSEFMSLATHEIRNPATFIKGYTAGALEGDLGELAPNVRDGMQKLYVRANDIIHLGNQYLNKSKLELKQLNYDYVPVDLKKLTEDLVHEFEPAVAQQGLTIHAVFEPGQDYIVAADSGKLKEVIANLIDNSIKYTPSGSVTVSAKRLLDSVQVTVVDTGVGVPAEVIPKLFQKFSRADAQKANILGTGLGLYIAKIFVDAHHGSIKVESDGKHGSTFTVVLPIKQPVAAEQPH